MKNAQFTKEFGQEIFVLNFSHDAVEETFPLIEECARQVRQRPENSVLTLTNVSKGRFDTAMIEKLKELTTGNKPYVRKSAVVGITGLYKVAMTAVNVFSKRHFKLCDDLDEAVKYLTQDDPV